MLALSLPFTLAWIAVVVAGLALEAVALIRKGRGDTATEHFRALIRWNPVVYFLALGLFAWIVVHMFAFGIVDRWIVGW